MRGIENTIICGDVLTELRKLPDESVNCCVTSPPYWGLRDYGTAKWEGGDSSCNHQRDSKCKNTSKGQKNVEGSIGDGIYKAVCKKCGAVRVDNQLGLEQTPEEYVSKIIEVFCEVKRVLKNDGTLWLNLGDSYCAARTNGNPTLKSTLSGGKLTQIKASERPDKLPAGYKTKNLIGIPWRVAFALQQDGWYLRSDIIWSKPNPMPESVTDRPTKAHEYIFLLSKNAKYYYDAESIKEKAEPDTSLRDRDSTKLNNTPGRTKMGGLKVNDYNMRNKRSVWEISTQPFPEAHFAVYPEELIKPCILAGCPERGIVLDPFMGSGTTALVARNLNRKYIGIELNPEYIKIIEHRLQQQRAAI